MTIASPCGSASGRARPQVRHRRLGAKQQHADEQIAHCGRNYVSHPTLIALAASAATEDSATSLTSAKGGSNLDSSWGIPELEGIRNCPLWRPLSGLTLGL